jgi:DNA-binding transcriptional LysR family regulator
MRAQFVELISVVVEAGSLGAATIRLGKSQPAVSKASQVAEQDIGCQIFQRGPAGVVPTIEGQRVVERCRMIMRDLDLLEEDVAQIHGDLCGTLNLIVSPVAAVQILPRVLRRFMRLNPRVQVQVTAGHSR